MHFTLIKRCFVEFPDYTSGLLTFIVFEIQNQVITAATLQ